jgi:short-subunit dehydrogenase
VMCPGVIRTSMPDHALWRGRAADPAVRARITARYLERGHPASQVADAIFSAVQHNKALVPVGREAWAAYAMKRSAPRLAAWMSRHRGSLR